MTSASAAAARLEGVARREAEVDAIVVEPTVVVHGAWDIACCVLEARGLWQRWQRGWI